ncbi:hypothetical protein DFS34DRAFT_675110 [Phlyctochytrium arcticum]|nr:hypothetical protein DFS34DRAFT_675110 [Phlyctochytrium arcticum]
MVQQGKGIVRHPLDCFFPYKKQLCAAHLFPIPCSRFSLLFLPKNRSKNMDTTGHSSSKGDESLSVTTDSKGQTTMSTSTWSFRRFAKAIITGRPPLAVILISFMTSLAVAAAITACLQQRKDIFSALTWTAYPQGLLNGVVWETGPTGDTVWLKLRHEDGDTSGPAYNSTTMALYQTYILDGKDGRDKPVDGNLVVANPRKVRASRYTNDTAKVALGKGWTYEPVYDLLNLSDPKSSAWLPYYVLGFKAGVGFKPFSKAIQHSNGTALGAMTAGMSMAFLNALSKATAAIPYRSQVYALEMDGTNRIIPIADSVNSVYISNVTNTLYSFDKAHLASSNLGKIYDHMARHPGGASAYIQARQGELDKIEMADGNYAMQTVVYQRSGGLKIGIIMLVNRNDVMRALVESNRRAIGIIVAVVVVGIILSIVFSFMLARALFRITRDLHLLANFQFKDVLRNESEKGMPARPQYSRIQELFQIQKAFHLMTVNFAKPSARTSASVTVWAAALRAGQ